MLKTANDIFDQISHEEWSQIPASIRNKLYDTIQACMRENRIINDRLNKLTNSESYWQNLDGVSFENELASALMTAGFDVQTTKLVGDDGIDLIVRNGSKIIIVQCKAHQGPVGVSAVRELYGVVMSDDAFDEAVLASVSGFTSGVHDFLSAQLKKPVHLWGLDQIIALKHGLVPHNLDNLSLGTQVWEIDQPNSSVSDSNMTLDQPIFETIDRKFTPTEELVRPITDFTLHFNASKSVEIREVWLYVDKDFYYVHVAIERKISGTNVPLIMRLNWQKNRELSISVDRELGIYRVKVGHVLATNLSSLYFLHEADGA